MISVPGNNVFLSNYNQGVWVWHSDNAASHCSGLHLGIGLLPRHGVSIRLSPQARGLYRPAVRVTGIGYAMMLSIPVHDRGPLYFATYVYVTG